MSSLKQRLILAGTAIPAIFGAVLFLPHFNFIVIALASAVFSGLGAMEMSRMFGKRGIVISPVQSFLSGAALPLSAWIDETGMFPTAIFPLILFLFLGIIIARQAFILKPERLKGTLEKTSASLFLVLYPGFFMSYIPRMCSLQFPSLTVLLFLCLVFTNDSTAYGAGMLLGGGNRNIFAASPNKSIAGLIGGIVGSIITAYIFYAVEPELFLGNPLLPPFIALLCASASDIGDLAESAIKRSVEVKDSGTILKGRGGVMDSIDSVLYGAPVFYYSVLLLTRQGIPG